MTIAIPQSFNRYSYVSNDPVNMSDPSGLMAKEGQPDPDTADPKDDPPGDPFETGRSITAEAEGRFDAGVKQAIALSAFNDAMESGDVDGARDIIAANPSIGHEMNSSYNPNAEGPERQEIKVADVYLFEGADEKSKIVGKGSVDRLIRLKIHRDIISTWSKAAWTANRAFSR